MRFINKKNYFILFAYIIFPLTTFELFSQIIYFKELNEKAYMVERIMTNPKKRSLREAGLHSPNMDRLDSYSTLYSSNYNSNNYSQKVRFRTDNNGTIIPSNIDKLKAIPDKYILFCGGSSIENSVVKEGQRITDKFSNKKKIASVNASKSGKDFTGCSRTINYLIKKTSSKPQAIIIGTNINTFMDYAFKYKSNSKYLRILFPGLMQYYSKIRDSFKESNIRLDQSRSAIDDNSKGLSGYETWLLKGCCYGPSSLNMHGRREIKWVDKNILDKYKSSLRKSIADFKILLIENKLSLKDIYIYIEPNSFGLSKLKSKNDYRQKLYSYEGERLDFNSSGEIANKYDDIYEQEFIKAGFKVIRIPLNIFNEYDFYDAAHFTQSGSDKVANYLSRIIDLN